MIKKQIKLVKDKILTQANYIIGPELKRQCRKPRGYWINLLESTPVGGSFPVTEAYVCLNLKVIAKKLGMSLTQYKDQGFWRITRVK